MLNEESAEESQLGMKEKTYIDADCQVDESDFLDGPPNSAYVRLEKKLEDLQRANMKLSKRIGDEIIKDSDTDKSISSEDEYQTTVNTRHMQLDQAFSGPYYFLTNVGFQGDLLPILFKSIHLFVIFYFSQKVFVCIQLSVGDIW